MNLNGPIVAKFGGSSLADAGQFRKVAEILRSDSDRRYVVVSAPGKRSDGDVKVTDMLYRCYEAARSGEDFEPVLGEIAARFSGIAQELGVALDLDAELGILRRHLSAEPERDYMASRGEYLNAKLMASFLDVPFLDAADCVRFDSDGRFLEEETQTLLSAALQRTQRAVLPGFYGADAAGRIHTFSRGGSDVTGALVARAADARIYENWTDVSGMLFTDPRVVKDPRSIDYVSYQELRELSYMGSSVLHEDAVFPARKAEIPINIRNTNRPQDRGTYIGKSLPVGAVRHAVTGIAGRKGFSALQIEKSMMNSEVGFGARLLTLLSAYGIPFEHCPSGIDTISVVVDSEMLEKNRESLLRNIEQQLRPDSLSVESGLAMIAVVGQGMVKSRGIAARVLTAVADAGVNLRMLDQGSSELNIILGVKETDYAAAVNGIYKAVADL